MGLLSWFFPSAEDRIVTARSWIAEGDWAEARQTILGVDHPDAVALVAQCEAELCRLNLAAAVSWADAGDEDRVRHHLDVAENFKGPGLEEDFREARRALRTKREARQAEKAAAAAAHDLSAQHAAVPAFLQDDNQLTEGQDEESAARISLIVESYAPALRNSVGTLGATFAQALLDLENGRADLSLQGLLTLPDDQPVIRYERARAAYAMGDPAATTRELKAFAELHGQHVDMGRHHTGLFLATTLTESGSIDEALAFVRTERKRDPDFGAGLYAQLLEIKGELKESERVLVALVRTYPKDSGLYALLGRVRAAQGNRHGAMTTLEAGLEACACAPGTCGFRPPDVRVIRSLATLYLEDGVDTKRGLELAQQAQGLVQQPTWEDVYLQALAARSSGMPEAKQLAATLWEHTPTGDERQERLQKFLPAPPAA